LQDAGHLAPNAQRLHIEELAAEMPASVNERQRQGTIDRINAGKGDQPTLMLMPVPVDEPGINKTLG
jgi:hypothetical protein